MKNFLLTFISVLVVAVLLSVSFPVQAQLPGEPTPGARQYDAALDVSAESQNASQGSTPIPPPRTSNATAQNSVIQNPIKADNLQCLVLQLFKLAVNVLAFVSVGYILWAGFLFVKAQGNEKELEVAKNTLRNAVIGTALIMGAWVFAEIITRTVNQITGNNNPVTINQNQC